MNQIEEIRSFVAKNVGDPCSRQDVFARPAPIFPSSYALPFQPVLNVFETGLIDSESSMTIGTRVEMRMRSETIAATDDERGLMDAYQTIRDWRWFEVLLQKVAETAPRFEDAFVGLNSFDYYRYIRNSVWLLECEHSLACAIFLRNYDYNLRPQVTLMSPGLPRSVLLSLLMRSVGVAHVCGNIGFGFKDQHRVHELFLALGYLPNCEKFGHPFGGEGVMMLMSEQSDFSGLQCLNMEAALPSKRYSKPANVGCLPDYCCALQAASMTKEQRATCEHQYNEIVQFAIGEASWVQLQFQSLSNPFSEGVSDWSGKPKFEQQPAGEPETGDLVVELEEIGAERGYQRFRFAEPGIGPGYGDDVTPALRLARQNLLKRCLMLIAIDICDMHGDCCNRKDGTLALQRDPKKKISDDAFQYVLNSDFHGQKSAVFFSSFWKKLIAYQSTIPTITKPLELVPCKDDLKQKLLFLLHDKGVFAGRKPHPWSKASVTTVFRTQQGQLGLIEKETIIWELRTAIADFLGVIIAEQEFAFPLFEIHRLRFDKIWIFPFEKVFDQPLSAKARRRARVQKKIKKQAQRRQLEEEASEEEEESDEDEDVDDDEDDDDNNPLMFNDDEFIPRQKRQSIRKQQRK